MNEIEKLRNVIVAELINPILYLLFGIGLLVFIFGLVEFLYGLSTETDARNRGKTHMLYGLIGMFVMMTAYAIVRLIATTVGGASLGGS